MKHASCPSCRHVGNRCTEHQPTECTCPTGTPGTGWINAHECQTCFRLLRLEDVPSPAGVRASLRATLTDSRLLRGAP